MNDILDGLEDVLDGIDADDGAPAPLPVAKKPRAKQVKATPPAALVSAPVNTAPQVEAIGVSPASDPIIDKGLQHYGFSGKRVKIVVERGHDPTDLPAQYFKLQDYACTIKRGDEVEVPIELLDVLDHATQTSFSQPQDGILIPHDSLRFPYRIIG